MTTNKKLVVTVGVMAVALILALTGIIVVLVTANQRASSAVNVRYTSSDVAVTLSATAYLGGNTHQFTKGGVVGGETELVLSPTVTEGSLSQTSDIASFDLTKTNTYVVFEYVFQNKTGNIDVKIDQDGVPATKENINLTYTYSDAKITNFATLEDNAEVTAQLLPAYTGEETVKYVYIKAQIADLLYDSSLVGDFGWALSKPNEADVNTVTLSIANADLVERSGSNLSNTTVTSDYTYKTLETTVDTEDISILPAVVDKAFVGWSETEGGAVISAINTYSDETHNALRGTTATTLYPVYKDGNVECYMNGQEMTATYSSSDEVVVPDITTYEGSVVKVTAVDSFLSCMATSFFISNTVTSVNTTFLFANENLVSLVVASKNPKYDSRDNCNAIIETSTNTMVKGCKGTTFPSSVTSIGEYAFNGCMGLTSMTIPSSITSIGKDAFNTCEYLASIIIPSSVTSIGSSAFYGCSSLTSIIIPSSVTSIGSSAFSGCSGLTSITVESGNTVYDSRDNCNALIETATNTLIIASKNTTFIPASITSIGNGAFSGLMELTSITIPSTVTSIGKSAFSGCTGLTSITIPASVKYINAYAFSGCTGLLSANGGSGIIFEDTTTWRSSSTLGGLESATGSINVTNPTQNATWLVSTKGYYNYYWGKF